MQALVYQSPNKKAFEERLQPELTAPADAIVGAGPIGLAALPTAQFYAPPRSS
jgi:threonine dehydrogenase-like Zn-dependent dehydrogenase